jgi:putative ABC transport system permease protein
MNPLPVALAELARSRVGAAAAIALVAVAAALGVALTAQERALREGSARAADSFDLLVGRRGSPTQLVLTAVYLQPAPLDLVPGETFRRIHGEPGAVWAAPLVFGDSYRGLPVVGSTADLVTAGGARPLAEGRVFQAMHEVVVGADARLPIGHAFAPAHGHGAGEGSVHEGFSYVVVGRMPRTGSPWDRSIVAPVEAVWRLHARPSGHAADVERVGPPWEGRDLPGASAVVVKPRTVADAYRLRSRYREGETMALFPAEVLVELYAILGDARDLLSLVALATQALVVAAVLLAVLAAEAQRRRQLGVLRALGAPRAYVFAVVWLDVTVLVAAGAVAGLVLGWAGALGASAMLQARTGVALTVTIGGHELALVGGLLVAGALLAVLPAWRSYRQPAASLLRA